MLQQRVELAVERQVEVRDRLLGLGQAARDHLAHVRVRDLAELMPVGREAWHRRRPASGPTGAAGDGAGAWLPPAGAGAAAVGPSRAGCRASAVPPAMRGLDVGLDDAAVRAAALDLRRGRARPARPCAWRAGSRRCGRRRRDRCRRGRSLPVRRWCGGAGCRRSRRRRRRLPDLALPRLRSGASLPPPSSAQASSPSSSSRAIGWLTFTPSVPSWHQDLAERALVDGLDLHGRLVGLDLGDDVAGLDRSPSFFSHLARLPSVMVGDSAGIRILIGMVVPMALRPSCGSETRLGGRRTTSSTCGSASRSRLAA